MILTVGKCSYKSLRRTHWRAKNFMFSRLLLTEVTDVKEILYTHTASSSNADVYGSIRGRKYHFR